MALDKSSSPQYSWTPVGRGTKRKFDFDVEAVGRLATAAEDAALAVLAKEHADSRVAKLPAFWLYVHVMFCWKP
jgi:hypothetical protein